ncbi:outer dynein arm-docking complex subunit 2 isoform X2 [Nelusetta ayraudi]|uniref:outer dynein arm-docking complex subunit 2 isoform X2 n=1 Tax=Nelusetta ayraudi TaxID=303726 RepID=UPI003F6F3EB5
MGASLTRAAQWTTASWEGGELEAPPPMNDFLLGEILRFAETFDSRHPREAEHVFKEPLQWRTALAASDFKTGYDIRNSDVQSREKDGDGRPLLQLCPPAVSVRSFGQLSKLLQLAGDKKLGEVRACLQENRGLVAKILGRRFADVLEDAGGRSGAQSLAGAEAEVELFLLLQSVDERLLEQSLRGTPELDPAAVRAEVELLQRLCDEGERRALKSVRHTSDYEFSNGHSAPPGGQQHMDICNLIIEPCDTETLHVTCSTAGVFLTKQGQEGGSERTSDVFRDLVALLKSRSPHFAASIKQDFAVRELPSARGTRHVESVEAEERGQRHGPREPQEKNAPEKARVQRGPHRAGGKKKYEPCPRWTSLRRSSSNGEMKEPMSGDLHKRKAGLGAKGKMKGELSVSSVPAGLSSQKIKTPAGGDVFNESSSESEEEEEEPERCPESNVDLPSEYWQIQKLVKYLKGGDQTATVLTLCALMDFSLMQETCQLAIRDVGGLEVLINLLDTDEVKCKIGSLKILRKICHNVQIRQAIVDMGGLQSIVAILDSPVKELQALAAETVANVARFRRARRIVRQYGGIRKLVKLLDCVSGLAKLTAKNQERDVEVARCGALALWSCSKTSRNKEAIRQAGGIPLLGRLLKSPHKNMLIPVVGTLQECASVENYRIAIQTEGMIKDLVKNLSSDNDELQMHCASAIFKNHRPARRRAPGVVPAEEPQRRRAAQRRLGSLSVRGERKGRRGNGALPGGRVGADRDSAQVDKHRGAGEHLRRRGQDSQRQGEPGRPHGSRGRATAGQPDQHYRQQTPLPPGRGHRPLLHVGQQPDVLWRRWGRAPPCALPQVQRQRRPQEHGDGSVPAVQGAQQLHHHAQERSRQASHPLHGFRRRCASGILGRLRAQHCSSGSGEQGHAPLRLTPLLFECAAYFIVLVCFLWLLVFYL